MLDDDDTDAAAADNNDDDGVYYSTLRKSIIYVFKYHIHNLYIYKTYKSTKTTCPSLYRHYHHHYHHRLWHLSIYVRVHMNCTTSKYVMYYRHLELSDRENSIRTTPLVES